MKKSIKLLSTLCAATLALGAGIALSSGIASAQQANADDTKTVYLDLNEFTSWENDGAKFGVYDLTHGSWSTFMSPVSNVAHLYSVEISASCTSARFTRQNSSAQEPSGSSQWNSSGNADVSSDNCCVITDWTSQKYTKSISDIVEDGAYLLGSMNEWTPSSENKMAYSSSSNEYSIEASLEVDDEFKIVTYARGNVATYYGFEVLEGGDGSARKAGQIISASGNMKSTVKAAYTMYFKVNSSSIWIGEGEILHTRELSVKHGEEPAEMFELSLNSGNEWMSEEIQLYSGDVLAYYLDGAVQTCSVKSIGNNNCWSNGGVTTVCLDMSAKVYVDINLNTIFVGGLTVDKMYMSVNNEAVSLSYNSSPADPSFTEWYTTGYEFENGDVIKFVDTKASNSNAVVFDVIEINSYSVQGFSAESGELTCVADEGVTADVYAKFKTGEDEVYFGSVSEDKAVAYSYAKDFNSSLGLVCVGKGQTVVADLQAAWQSNATAFAGIIESAQLILKNATSSDANPDLAEFAGKYDYVYASYSADLESYGGNFVDRGVVSSAPYVGLFGANDSNTAIIVIIAVSLVSLTAVGGFFYYRKRKHN